MELQRKRAFRIKRGDEIRIYADYTDFHGFLLYGIIVSVDKLRYFFLLLIFLISVIAAAQNHRDIAVDRFEEVPGRGLAINTNPKGVRVFINGIERGVTPIVFDSFPPGEYSVRLIREGYIDREFPVTLFSASRLLVSIKMEMPKGKMIITVLKDENAPLDMPFNPQVTVNTMFFTSPLELTGSSTTLLLPLGRHTIRARAKGWQNVTMTVFITEEITPVEIVMKPVNRD